MLRYFHLLFGLALFVAFLVTGQFMRHDFPDKSLINQELRVLMRSRHIYILLISVTHLMVGLYVQVSVSKFRAYLQYFGSFLISAAGLIMIYAFAHESYDLHNYSDYSRNALYLVLGGAGLHVFGGFQLKSKTNA